MQIKVTNYGSSANCWASPSGSSGCWNLGLAEGESITLTAINEHEASGIDVGGIESIAVADSAVPEEESR